MCFSHSSWELTLFWKAFPAEESCMEMCLWVIFIASVAAHGAERGLGHHCSLRDTARNLLHWMRQFHQNHRYFWIETDMQWILLWWNKTQVVARGVQSASCDGLVISVIYSVKTNDTFSVRWRQAGAGQNMGLGMMTVHRAAFSADVTNAAPIEHQLLRNSAEWEIFIQSLNSFNTAANLGLNSIKAALHHSVVLQRYIVFRMVIVRWMPLS